VEPKAWLQFIKDTFPVKFDMPEEEDCILPHQEASLCVHWQQPYLLGTTYAWQQSRNFSTHHKRCISSFGFCANMPFSRPKATFSIVSRPRAVFLKPSGQPRSRSGTVEKISRLLLLLSSLSLA
jgi:hypothetical protein